MAKAKKKKAQKGKGILEPDVMVYIYSLAAIAVSLIGCRSGLQAACSPRCCSICAARSTVSSMRW